MKTSERGIDFIKEREGCSLIAYKDCVGVLTIGYGITNADKGVIGTSIKAGMKIDRDTADKWLRLSISQKYEKKVRKYQGIYGFNQNQWDALVSFAFNIGSIDQLTANGTRSIDEIAEKIPAYCKAGGKSNKGLVERRRMEQDLFRTPTDRKVKHDMDTLRKGDTGQQVICLQMALNLAGAEIKADGIFGGNTLEAVINFQGANCLEPDGIVGQKTWRKLLLEE